MPAGCSAPSPMETSAGGANRPDPEGGHPARPCSDAHDHRRAEQHGGTGSSRRQYPVRAIRWYVRAGPAILRPGHRPLSRYRHGEGLAPPRGKHPGCQAIGKSRAAPPTNFLFGLFSSARVNERAGRAKRDRDAGCRAAGGGIKVMFLHPSPLCQPGRDGRATWFGPPRRDRGRCCQGGRCRLVEAGRTLVQLIDPAGSGRGAVGNGPGAGRWWSTPRAHRRACSMTANQPVVAAGPHAGTPSREPAPVPSRHPAALPTDRGGSGPAGPHPRPHGRRPSPTRPTGRERSCLHGTVRSGHSTHGPAARPGG
jgi:hypothetical protein